MIPIGPHDWVNHCIEVLESIFGKTDALEVQNCFFKFFSNYIPTESQKPQVDDLPNLVAQPIPLGELLDIK